MKRFLFLFAGLFAMSTAIMAQGPVLHFETTSHDFGRVKEDDGPVTYRYKFTNTGTSNLKITQVQPACGCTTSNWTKDSVAPGKSGYVDATFDVSHRPGHFSKSVTIYSNSNPNISLLTFSGEVLPHVKSLSDSFPYEMGNIRFEINNVNFERLNNNVTDTVGYLPMVNTGNNPVIIKELNSKGYTYIFAKNLPFTVPPHARVKFPIHYNPSQVRDYGFTYSEVSLVTSDEKMPEKKISILADIHQYVPKMTDEEKLKAARIFFPDNSHDFGAVKQGDIVTTEFAFTNKGKKDLIIYKVKTSCGCTVSEPEKSKLRPGETSNIKVSFNSSGKNGKEEKQITVYSNDPVNTEYTLKIFANISLNGGKTDNKPGPGSNH
jgi:hypothetical protein